MYFGKEGVDLYISVTLRSSSQSVILLLSLLIQACSVAIGHAWTQSTGWRPLVGELWLGGAPCLADALLWTPRDPDSLLWTQPGPWTTTLQRQQHRVMHPWTQTWCTHMRTHTNTSASHSLDYSGVKEWHSHNTSHCTLYKETKSLRMQIRHYNYKTTSLKNRKKSVKMGFLQNGNWNWFLFCNKRDIKKTTLQRLKISTLHNCNPLLRT